MDKCQHQLRREQERCLHGFFFGTTCESCLLGCPDCWDLYSGSHTWGPRPTTRSFPKKAPSPQPEKPQGLNQVLSRVRGTVTEIHDSHGASVIIKTPDHLYCAIDGWPGMAVGDVVDVLVVRTEQKPCNKPEDKTPTKRACNRHNDCDAADDRAKKAGHLYAEHCHDDCCEDCFGT